MQLRTLGLRATRSDRPEDATGLQPSAASSPAEVVGSGPTLTSVGGDLEVTVRRAGYDLATRWHAVCKPDDDFRLYLNGVGVVPSAVLYGQQISADGASVALVWRLGSGVAARSFWRAVYHANELTGEGKLHLALGWPSTGANSVVAGTAQVLKVRVATENRQLVAGVALILLALLMVFMIMLTDTFRDDVPRWLQLARTSAAAYTAAASDTDRLALLLRIAPAYDAAVSAQAARDLRAGRSITTRDPSAAAAASGAAPLPMLTDEAVAAGLLQDGLPLPQPAYSLARVQLGLWFAFAVATGLFLWIIYGELLAISGSALALLGISVGTAAATIAVTPDSAGQPANASRGLLLDLVTGFDQSQQVHRYQAVVVNALLMLVGASFVWTELGFPTFDNTWLAFLGLSGATLAGGKQMLESAPFKSG